ncbi:MAG: hypothetical protein IPK21_15505 [Haliscomenobacter sp.]|nr:hypothetical protein [Haliscomenobacter sp.]
MRKIHLNRTFLQLSTKRLLRNVILMKRKEPLCGKKPKLAFYGLSARAEPDSICDKMNKALETGITEESPLQL